MMCLLAVPTSHAAGSHVLGHVQAHHVFGGSQADGSYADSKGGRARELLLSAETRIYIPETQEMTLKVLGSKGEKSKCLHR